MLMAMRYRVYRSLDKSPSLFGIQGGYFVVFGAVLLVGGGLAFLLCIVLGTTAGIITFMASVLVAYFVVMFLQEKYSEKELRRFLSNLFLPEAVRIPPSKPNLSDCDGIW